MSWLKKRPQRLQVPAVRFVGEQDGQPEHDFKSRVIELFEQDATVKNAYLARVSYHAGSAVTVALCVRGHSEAPARIVESVGKIFGAMFGKDQHLDIVFLDASQEAELAKVCRAFFVR